MKQNLIGIQGGPGSYHEEAVRLFADGLETVSYRTFGELFGALERGDVPQIMTAIANNRVQYIPDPYEFLTAPDAPYVITGETYVRVEHMLLGLPGASLESIKEVHSQAPALGQCSRFLEYELAHAEIVEQTDTAGSAALVAEKGDISKAAIASSAAGEIYGLTPLAESIQDDSANITRFVVLRLADNADPLPDANKTTMLMSTPQTVGALADALVLFKQHGINITSLQSKIIPNSAFDMLFFIEFSAGAAEPRTTQLLDTLRSTGYKTKLLGSYRAAAVPFTETLETN